MQELTAFTGISSKDGKSLQVRSTPDELKVSFPVIAYPTLFQSGLASLMIEKNKEPRLVVIAGKISPELRSQLRELEIGYLDAAGNIFLKASRFFVLVDGQKDYPPSTKEKRQLFSKSGILIIFHLLTSPEIAGRTYRDLAETLDISLGSVAQTMAQLKKAGFLLKLGKTGWRLHNKKTLLDRWITAYAEQLKPSLLLGRYRFAAKDYQQSWQELDLPPGTQWGGEPAANLMTRYLQPAEWTIYSDQDTFTLLKELRLVPDKGGNVWIYERFWKDQQAEEPSKTVPALLVYGDLVASGDPRNFETAQKIWDEQFKDQF